MTVKLLTKYHLEFLSLKGGCTGSSESTHISKCHIIGNHVSWLIYIWYFITAPSSTIKYISDIFEDIGTVVVEVYIAMCIFLILLYLLV